MNTWGTSAWQVTLHTCHEDVCKGAQPPICLGQSLFYKGKIPPLSKPHTLGKEGQLATLKIPMSN